MFQRLSIWTWIQIYVLENFVELPAIRCITMERNFRKEKEFIYSLCTRDDRWARDKGFCWVSSRRSRESPPPSKSCNFIQGGRGQNKCNFLDHIHSCIYRFNCSKMFTLTTTVFRFKMFHIWFVKYVLMNLLGLNKLSKLIPMSIYKEFQTVQYREI